MVLKSEMGAGPDEDDIFIIIQINGVFLKMLWLYSGSRCTVCTKQLTITDMSDSILKSIDYLYKS